MVRPSPGQLVAGAARRPRRTIAVVAVAALAGGLLALSLRPSTGLSTLVSAGSADYRATVSEQRHFGGDTVVVLVREPLSQLVVTRDLETISGLEACLAGEELAPVPTSGALLPLPAARARPYGGRRSPCAALMRERPAAVVYGPGTFVNRAVAAVRDQLTRAAGSARAAIDAAERTARELARRRGLPARQVRAAADAAGALEARRLLDTVVSAALHTGITSAPTITDAAFVRRVVFTTVAGRSVPNPRFAYVFPSASAAVIQVRLRASLSGAGEARAISLIRAAVRMPRFRLGHGGSYLVGGEPVVLHDLAGLLGSSIAVLLGVAVAVMGLVLLIAFGGPLSLLALALALAAAAITFGLAALAGATVTVASVAVVPILIGLAVDYAVQFQSRVREERRRAAPAHGAGGPDLVPVASLQGVVARAGSDGAPAIAIAAFASAAGFLALLLSPVPMVRGFGLLLVLGVGTALACTLSAGAAALALAAGGKGAGRRGRAVARLMPSIRGAAELLWLGLAPLRRLGGPTLERRRRSTRARPTLARLLGALTRWPGRLLLIASLLGAAGWIAGTRISVQSDPTKLVPQSMPALRDLRALERATGSSGEIDVLVRGRDLAAPAVVRWMTSYESALLSHFGSGGVKRCAAATLCPALSLPELFAGGGQRAATGLTAASIDALLSSVPRYFASAVITPDRRYAVLAFGIRLMPLAEQRRVIAYMRSRLHPPPGASASLAGIPVLAADAEAALASGGRRLLTSLASLLAVALALLVALRSVRRALVPLIPIVLANGFAALVVYLSAVPLNPMSATLGALVIAITTEFSVLLTQRFHRERARGAGVAEALQRAYASTGAAVLASAATAVAGFAVLVASNITMLRDFGLVTVIDLTVSLAGVLVTLPAALALTERVPVRFRVGRLRAGRVQARGDAGTATSGQAPPDHIRIA